MIDSTLIFLKLPASIISSGNLAEKYLAACIIPSFMQAKQTGSTAVVWSGLRHPPESLTE